MNPNPLHQEIETTLGQVSDLTSRPIVIWGAGSMAREVYAIARAHGAGVAGFIDGTEAAAGQSVEGLPVQGPDQMRRLGGARPFIVIASTWWREIGMDLINLGYAPNDHFIPAQRRVSSSKWNLDVDDPRPIYIGRKTHRYEGLLAYYPEARPKQIGAFCSIAHGVRLAANHCLEFVTSHPFVTHRIHGIVDEDRADLYAASNPPAEIGNDVWLGYNACILPGVTIGDGAIVGANAVVTKPVPPYAIVVGVPAKIVRYRFDAEKIRMLRAVRWWTWSDRRLRQHVDDLRSPERFFRLAEKVTTQHPGDPDA